MKVIGLGTGVGGDVEAEAFVVTSFEDLENNKEKVAGKIVVFYVPWVSYGTTVAYRS